MINTGVNIVHTLDRRLILLLIPIFLSFNLSAQQWFTTGQHADLMLSGAGFNNAGGALLFNHPSGIASDGARFLLCDRFNNRVLIWKSLPSVWNAQPDLVLGQKNFVTNNSGASKSELNFPGNVSVAANGTIAVADTDNDRILIWTTFPSSNGQAADLEIHLPSLQNQGSPMRYSWPWGVWTDGARLAVVATHGSSILFWNTLPSRDNQSPDYTITHQHFGTPRNISTDGSTYFFVGDHNSKVTTDKPGTFFWNTYPTQSNQAYDFYREGEWIKGTRLPDGRLIAAGMASLYLWNTMPLSASEQPHLTIRNSYYKNGDGPDVVFVGGRLYVNNYNGTNVQVYNSIPASSTQIPDFVLGSPSISVNLLDSIQYIQNPMVATDGKILLASSDFDATLWIWKTIPGKSGAAPDIKIPLRTPQLDIASWDNALWGNSLVLAGKQKVVVWNSLPLNGEPPALTFSDRIGSFQFQELKGVALDSLYFYLAEGTGRIGIWKGMPTSSSSEPIITFTLPAVNLNNLHSDGKYFVATVMDGSPRGVYLYRVAELRAGVTPQPHKLVQGTVELTLNLPFSAITFGNSLAIANNANNSVLLWKNVEEAGDVSKVVVLGQTSLAGTIPGIASNKLHFPGSLAAAGNSLWVAEFKFSSRILRFQYSAPATIDGRQEEMQGFALYQNHPNPFNANTVIGYQLPEAGHVTLRIFDVLGREVALLVDEFKNPGTYQSPYSTVNSPISSGIYFYRLQTGSSSLVRKMIACN